MKKKIFICSLCRGGILGGALYLDESSVTYRTNKLTVDSRYRNLVLLRSEIKELLWRKNLPIATFCMKNGEKYTFIIFGKKRFEKSYKG